MSRRRYLAVEAAALIAGCNSGDSEPTPTRTTTATPTPAQTATDTQTATATDTDTETVPPGDEGLAADLLADARSAVGHAAVVFRPATDGETIADVDCAEEVDGDRIDAELNAAAESIGPSTTSGPSPATAGPVSRHVGTLASRRDRVAGSDGQGDGGDCQRRRRRPPGRDVPTLRKCVVTAREVVGEVSDAISTVGEPSLPAFREVSGVNADAVEHPDGRLVDECIAWADLPARVTAAGDGDPPTGTGPHELAGPASRASRVCRATDRVCVRRRQWDRPHGELRPGQRRVR